MSDERANRLTEEPWVLVRQAMGSPDEFRAKLRKLAYAVVHYGRNDRVVPRLRRLRELGYIDTIPTRTQRIVGALDMLRFFIVPCAADYYEGKGINFRFHTLLRFLDDPASIIDPTGFNSTRDAIIGHVMQVVHANPDYDLQLLESFEGGLDEMEQQVRAVLDGSHPRAASIRAIVEDPDYHSRLLQHIAAFRAGRAERLVRENIAENSEFAAAEQTFGTVPAAMRYFSRMPRRLGGGLRHLLRVRDFPIDRAA